MGLFHRANLLYTAQINNKIFCGEVADCSHANVMMNTHDSFLTHNRSKRQYRFSLCLYASMPITRLIPSTLDIRQNCPVPNIFKLIVNNIQLHHLLFIYLFYLIIIIFISWVLDLFNKLCIQSPLWKKF